MRESLEHEYVDFPEIYGDEVVGLLGEYKQDDEENAESSQLGTDTILPKGEKVLPITKIPDRLIWFSSSG